MKRFALIAALALVGCTGTPLPLPTGAPSDVANQTVLDEQIAIGAETAYTTASKLGTALAQADVIDREKFKVLDAKAYKALLAVRATYRAGNSAGYVMAANEVYAAVAEIRALVL